MTTKRRGPLADWLLILAMTLATHVLVIAGLLAAVGTAWYFDKIPWLLLLVPSALLLGGGAILDRRTIGFTLRPDDEPDLTALVRHTVDRCPFNQRLIVRVVPFAGASLGFERVEGSRTHVLDLGWPFLSMMTAEELSAVIAHELAHDGDIASLRGRALNAARNNLTESWPIPLVTRSLLQLTRATAVEKELDADQASATALGAPLAASALRRTAEIDEIFDTLVDHWCDEMTDAGEYPKDLYNCVRMALDDREVIEWVTSNRKHEPQLEDAEDTHPALTERIVRLDPSGVAPQVGTDPVRLRQHEAIERWCIEEVFQPTDNDFRPGSILSSPPGRFDFDPSSALADLREATGEQDTRAALKYAVSQIQCGGWQQLASTLSPEISQLPQDLRRQAALVTIVNCIGTALISPLVAAGWTRANPWLNQVLLSPDGERLNVYTVIETSIHEQDGTAVVALIDSAALGGQS